MVRTVRMPEPAGLCHQLNRLDELPCNRVDCLQSLAEAGNGFAILLQLAVRQEANLKV